MFASGISSILKCAFRFHGALKKPGGLGVVLDLLAKYIFLASVTHKVSISPI